MAEKIKQVIPMPYFFLAITIAPIFFISFLLPAHPDSQLYIALNIFLDTYLLGQVGYWSSAFPFSSKIVANYISLLGPAFALIFFLKVHRRMIIDHDQYKNHTVINYLLATAIMLGFVFTMIYISYFGSVDLGEAGRKWRLFGSNVFTYALFSSGALYILYFITLILYMAFYYLPIILIKRFRSK
ncbi:colicin immunity protein Cui [Pseudomonas antarctica]|uniref:colicin immunity protein Cui n=1 Tax=Pseudomonas antarctica TaxID=219572 RepID=UPI003F753F78